MRINECIKYLRQEHNFSQQQLADKLYISQDTISLWERGKCKPDIDMIIQMSKLFNVSTDYLLCIDDINNN